MHRAPGIRGRFVLAVTGCGVLRHFCVVCAVSVDLLERPPATLSYLPLLRPVQVPWFSPCLLLYPPVPCPGFYSKSLVQSTTITSQTHTHARDSKQVCKTQSAIVLNAGGERWYRRDDRKHCQPLTERQVQEGGAKDR